VLTGCSSFAGTPTTTRHDYGGSPSQTLYGPATVQRPASSLRHQWVPRRTTRRARHTVRAAVGTADPRECGCLPRTFASAKTPRRLGRKLQRGPFDVPPQMACGHDRAAPMRAHELAPNVPPHRSIDRVDSPQFLIPPICLRVAMACDAHSRSRPSPRCNSLPDDDRWAVHDLHHSVLQVR
jgi:hypothetical protein